MLLNQLKKIVILGPESTGKSTLSSQLANYFNTLWCPEFAREYLLTHGKNYSFEDLLTITKGQLSLENEYMIKVEKEERTMENGEWRMENGKRNEVQETSYASFNYHPLSFIPDSRFTIHDSPLLFIDTNMYVMKVWCEYVFGRCHQLILNEIADRKYDFYLLCNIDLPWVSDELREYPEEAPRRELYNIYKDILINQNTPWVDISGNYEERLQKGINAVNALIA